MSEEYKPGSIEEICQIVIREAREDFFNMNESWFVRDLLPMIAGEQGKGQDMTFWVQRIGYYRIVRVYEDRAMVGGKVADGAVPLFQLPPLIHNDGRKFRESTSDRDSVYEEMLTIENRMRNNPGRAVREVQQSLQQRLKAQSSEATANYAKLINSILARYGKPLLSEAIGIAGAPDSKAAPETNFYEGGEMGVELDD